MADPRSTMHACTRLRRSPFARLIAAVPVLVAVPLLLVMLAEPAAAEGEAVAGTLSTGDEPLAGVDLVISEADGGAELARVTTDDTGNWQYDLPGSGRYDIELDESTLPEGVALTSETNVRTLNVIGGLTLQVRFNFDEVSFGTPTLERAAQNIFSGIKVGLVISIAAVGLSLVFGTTGLINFAHGELVSFGAIVALQLNSPDAVGLPIVLAAVLAVVIGGAFGGALEVGFFAQLRRRRVSGFQFLVITIGLSLLFQSLLRLWNGNSFGQYGIDPATAIEIGPIITNARDLTLMGISLVVLVAVGVFLLRTRVGKAMRAVADNRDLAEASGIDVGRVVMTVWILSGSLAAVGGIVQGATANIHYLNGFKLLLLMFAAVILGGLGSAFGAMIGGLVVGIASEVSVTWAPAELKLVWALLILIGVLLFRPQGILGHAERLG